MGLLNQRKYRIHFYEIDYKKRVLPAAMINYLQDIAITQSEELGVGIDFLAEHHLAWALIQWDINIYQYPVLGQEVSVLTRPVAFEKVHAYREFWVHGAQGELLADAYSLWVLKDTEKNRITKIPLFMFDKYGIDENAVSDRKIVKPEELIRVDSKKEFSVRYSDIDTNRHVNNVKYLEWAVETMPLNIVINCVLERIRISYKKGTLFGDEVRVMTEVNEANGKIYGKHHIENAEGQTVCLLESLWKNEEEIF